MNFRRLMLKTDLTAYRRPCLLVPYEHRCEHRWDCNNDYDDVRLLQAYIGYKPAIGCLTYSSFERELSIVETPWEL